MCSSITSHLGAHLHVLLQDCQRLPVFPGLLREHLVQLHLHLVQALAEQPVGTQSMEVNYCIQRPHATDRPTGKSVQSSKAWVCEDISHMTQNPAPDPKPPGQSQINTAYTHNLYPWCDIRVLLTQPTNDLSHFFSCYLGALTVGKIYR